MKFDPNQNAWGPALKNLGDGKFYEPRVFFDSLPFSNVAANTTVFGNPDVLRNGEQFPVRITHMLAAWRGASSTDANDPAETLVQRTSLRILQHGNYYMNAQFVPLPHWANVISAAPDSVTQGTATWKFQQPFVLGARDTMQVKIALEALPAGIASARTVGASFTGYGLVSKAPIFVAATASLFTAAPTILPTDRFRNDGVEPWVITDMSLFCGAEANSASPAGDIRMMRVSIQQVGNGTNTSWMNGPVGMVTLSECPAVVLGHTTGRAIIHEIPGDGWIWEPGEGISLEAQSTTSFVQQASRNLAVSFLGHIVVT